MLGDRIKTLRTARNLSQVELARKLNVSKQSVSNWENNNILPSVDIVKKLALFFSCSTDYLLEMEQDRIMVEFTDLTPEQKAHIQLIINDMRTLNTKKIEQDSFYRNLALLYVRFTTYVLSLRTVCLFFFPSVLELKTACLFFFLRLGT